jgi:hypothetical protein
VNFMVAPPGSASAGRSLNDDNLERPRVTPKVAAAVDHSCG